MFRKVRLFKTISKQESKKVDICYRDYPDEENFASETIVELDYNDVLIMIKRHLAKDEEDNEVYAYGIFEFKLPGGVTINYSNLSDQASEEMEKIDEWIQNNRAADYFFMPNTL